MPAKKTDEPVDGAEETGDGDTKPALARFQVWQGTGPNRVITRMEPAASAEAEAMVHYQVEATNDEGPKEESSSVEAFEKWAKRCLGTIG